MRRLLITVSGGETSGYMAIKLWENYRHLYDMRFVFANTGQEHEKTLEFVYKIQSVFKLPVIWIEAKVSETKGVGTGYKITNFKRASRKGEPFEEIIKKYGLPNMSYLHCTRELKINPMKALCKDLGCEEQALGIRNDELHRYNPRIGFIYPLIEMFQVDKPKIKKWWKKQEFQLDLAEHLGNCTWCYKKSDAKLDILREKHPEVFKFPLKMEKKYKSERIIFRGHRTTEDLLSGVKGDGSSDNCPEECGTVVPTKEIENVKQNT